MDMEMNEKEITILIVDDVEVNLYILEEIIENMGYNAITATSVRVAQQMMMDLQVIPQIILSDISMPDIDGFAFCSNLKKNPYTRDVPVIFISAMDSVADLSQGFELGAVDYITKPFDRAEVEMRINNHLKLFFLQRNLEENNRRLNKIVTNQMEILKQEQKNIMTALAKLVEQKENVTKGEDCSPHYMNISYNSRILAQGMQLSDKFEKRIGSEFIDTIESSAGLHDIGKIMIPDSILLKEAHLTTQERDIMRSHAEVGAKTIGDIYKEKERNEFINMAIDIAYYHHENWDGSGYPKGLQGEEIPLAARIVKIIDVFDALLGERCYKKAYNIEDSLETMRKGIGTEFDPDIMEVFLKIYRNFRGMEKSI